MMFFRKVLCMMKCKSIIIILTILSVLLFCSACVDKTNSKYAEGKDTKESYGDGTYQLLQQNSESALFDSRYHTTVVDQVSKIKSEDNFVYVIGNIRNPVTEEKLKVFAVIDISKNQIKYCPQTDKYDDLPLSYANDMMKKKELILMTNYTDFNDKEQDVFRKMEDK